jgi:hypothetical protein
MCQLLQALLRQNVAARWQRTAGSDPLKLRAVTILHILCHRIWQQTSETCQGLAKLWYQYGLYGITAASFGALLPVLLQPPLQHDALGLARQLRLLADAMHQAHAAYRKLSTVAVICSSMLLGSKLLMQQLLARLAAPGAMSDAVLDELLAAGRAAFKVCRAAAPQHAERFQQQRALAKAAAGCIVREAEAMAVSCASRAAAYGLCVQYLVNGDVHAVQQQGCHARPFQSK